MSFAEFRKWQRLASAHDELTENKRNAWVLLDSALGTYKKGITKWIGEKDIKMKPEKTQATEKNYSVIPDG